MPAIIKTPQPQPPILLSLYQTSTLSTSHQNNGFLETIFAGIAVFIGLLALIVALLQLHRKRKRRAHRDIDQIYELEAVLPDVHVRSLPEFLLECVD